MKIIDLFSGFGGFSLGFEMLGYFPKYAFEVCEYAATTYAENIKKTQCFISDINDNFLYEYLSDTDILVAGCPCQDFSVAGKRLGTNGDNGKLLYRTLEIIKMFTPKVFVIENVPNILNFPKVISDIQLPKYRVNYYVLNAIDYCVPQNRKRCFFIGVEKSISNRKLTFFMNQKNSNNKLTVRDCIPQIDIDYYYSEPVFRESKSVWSVDEPSPTIRTQNRPYSPLLGVRTLTNRERLIVQSFPSDYILLGNFKKDLKGIGNSVPPLLAKHIAKAIIHSIDLTS